MFTNCQFCEDEQARFSIRIAGETFEVVGSSQRVRVLCQNYLCNNVFADHRIVITKSDIDREIENKKSSGLLFNKSLEISNKHGNSRGHLYLNNDSYLEAAAVYRKIADALLSSNTILMHGAVIALGDKAIMFTAPSGTGKTTHIRLWLKNLPDAIVVNGDKPLLKIENNGVTVFGTPWSGNEKLNTNTKKPLQSIVIIERSDENTIEKISFSKAYPFLLSQTYIPEDNAKGKKVLSLLSSLFRKVSFYHFKCNNFKDNCFKVAYTTLIGKNIHE